MNYLFTNAPLFVPSLKRHDLETHDLERRVEQIEAKQDVTHHEEAGPEKNF